MNDVIFINNKIRVYLTKSFDWETLKGNKRGAIEWLEIKDRNGKLIEYKAWHRGNDLPKYAKKQYWNIVKNTVLWRVANIKEG